MEACTLPLRVNVAEFINKSDFLGCNLNPVVVLTDIRKSSTEKKLTKGKISPEFPENGESEKARTHSISRNTEKQTPSKGSAKNKNISVMMTQRRSSSTLSNPKTFKSIKRKRESWDPSVEYELERVVGYHRDKRKKMWYLIKWKNWSSDHNTFEPIENLTGCHYKLMKFFETSQPRTEDIIMMSYELEEGLRSRSIYNRLMNNGYKEGDLAEFARLCPDAGQVFQAESLDELENRIRQEYGYIVRCLIGMRFHQDPGLIERGQNYKLLLQLIQMRRKQLEKNTCMEHLINSLEKVKITIENDVDLDEFPNINYIVDLKPGEGVVLPKDPLLGCECPNGCSLRSRCCGRMADSVFAYDQNGKLRTRERVAIYECNSRCLCPSTCPNRVVQRGRRVKLCIFKTKLCGWGVKALEKIPRGAFVCEYAGELIPDSEAVVRDVKYFGGNKSSYLFNLDFFIDPKLDMYCIDATKDGNVARFINHSCDPNLVVYPVWVDGLEPNLHRLAFFARRNIKENEEIHFDYENLDELDKTDDSKTSHGLRMFSNVRCQCKAANCREWIFGNK